MIAGLPNRPPTSSVPQSRGIMISTLQRAVVEIWGEEGLAAVRARLPADVAADTIGPGFLPIRWYPSTHMVAWHSAIFEGPANGDDAAFTQVMERVMDLSMGIVRRAFMRVLTPATLIAGAVGAWRDFHTHGEVTVEEPAPGSARMILSNHPFLESPASRKMIAIMARHIAVRSRAHDVQETHALVGGRLVTTVSWRSWSGG